MTDDLSLLPPGQARLFQVAPVEGARYEVVTSDGQRLVRTPDLAAAVIAAAAGDGVWVVAPDRWAVRIAADGGEWLVAGDGCAPTDAIRRVLALIPTTGGTS